MYKAVFILPVLILGALASGCASLNVAMVNDTAKPGVIIENAHGYTIYVYIDGKKIGSLQEKEIKGYELVNGNHILHYGYFDFLLFGGSSSDRVQFTVNNDRHYFRFGSYWGKISHNRTPVERSVAVTSSVKSSNARLLNTAITNSFNTVSRNIPVNSKIAIVNIASNNNADSSFILEELTLAFVNSRRFIVVDRQTLNVIRQEQNFQLSGEVSDETIISIGRFTGADVVITGSVSDNGEMRRLRLRVLDVQTAQILAMSAEKI
jgi:TolB-like protein